MDALPESLFHQGAVEGNTPNLAPFVESNQEMIARNDIDQGTVNILVSFALLKPAESVIIRVGQIPTRSRHKKVDRP